MIRYTFLIIISILGGFTTLYGQQRGKASYYAKRTTGARTSSGERLHHDSLTCAHKTYPFGTYLQVKNLQNGKTVVVKVNDRGPYVRGRIIDLSWGAAKRLGIISQGIATVEIKKVKKNGIPYKLEDMPSLPEINFGKSDITPTGVAIWQDYLYDNEEYIEEYIEDIKKENVKKNLPQKNKKEKGNKSQDDKKREKKMDNTIINKVEKKQKPSKINVILPPIQQKDPSQIKTIKDENKMVKPSIPTSSAVINFNPVLNKNNGLPTQKLNSQEKNKK